MATVPLKFPIVRITIHIKLQDNKIAAIMVTITFKIVIASVTITNKFCITNNESLMKNIKNSWLNSNSFYLKGSLLVTLTHLCRIATEKTDSCRLCRQEFASNSPYDMTAQKLKYLLIGFHCHNCQH